MGANTWKLQDAKAQFSELVRRARTGEPQHVTLHGKEAVVVFDPTRFELSAKDNQSAKRTMAGFLERARTYDLDSDIEIDRPLYMTFHAKRLTQRRTKRR